MTTRVRVSCLDCGEHLLRPADLCLFTSPNAWSNRFAFTCPQCRAWISRPVPPWLLSAFRQAGVPERRTSVPQEVFEPHRGPVISVDEVLDFVLELGRIDDVARFAGRP